MQNMKKKKNSETLTSIFKLGTLSYLEFYYEWKCRDFKCGEFKGQADTLSSYSHT